MSRFDWRTDGEDTWDEQADYGNAPAPKRSRRSWLLLIPALLGLAVSVNVISRRVDERVEAATANVTADVLSTMNLVRTAVLSDDGEIFHSMLSGRDKSWTEAQQTMFDQGILLDRTFLGLSAVQDAASLAQLKAGDPTISSIEVSPELAEAIVTTLMPYQVIDARGESSQIELGQVSVLRRGGQRWLVSPPLGEFWGPRLRTTGNRITLDYPDREKGTAERLARDLDDKLDEMCRELPELGCDDDFRVLLRLTTSPESLISAADLRSRFEQSASLTLPAVTLIGVPVDEAGYQALLRAYSARVVAAAISSLVNWECCIRGLFFAALTDYELSLLDIQPWPVTDADYERMFAEGIGPNLIARYWSARGIDRLYGQDGWQIYTTVDFLIKQFSRTPAPEMQRALTRRSDWSGWLAALLPGTTFAEREGIADDLEQDWWRAAARLVTANQAPPPIALPSQKLTLVCQGGSSDVNGMLRQLDLVTGNWSESLLQPGMLVAASPFADDTGILLSSFGINESLEDIESWKSSIWRLATGEQDIGLGGSSISLGQTDPSGKFLVVYDIEEGEDLPVVVLVDLDSCLAGDCSRTTLVGSPIWSPDGSKLLIVDSAWLGQVAYLTGTKAFIFGAMEDMEDQGLWRAEIRSASGDGSVEIKRLGEGKAPFWIDNDAYGFVRSSPDSSVGILSEVLVASSLEAEPLVIFDSNALRPALPDGVDEGVIRFKHTAVSPAFPNLVFLVAEIGSGRAFVFSYDRESGEILARFEAQLPGGIAFEFSPDGRWLMLNGYFYETSPLTGQAAEAVLFVHDIAANETQQFAVEFAEMTFPSVFDWNEDSRWLAIASGNRGITLLAPDYDYRRVIPREQGNCPAMFFINP